MSYRDLRNFLEMNRALGYHNLISIENFRKPNFQFISELLIWLIKRFDQDIQIQLKINNENDRVELIRNIAQFMAIKANVKLNTKKLYQADGYSIKELLKIIKILYDALNVNNLNGNEENLNNFDLNDFDVTDKVSELKLCRQLASEITQTGATLYELLGKEVDLRVQRQKSLSRQFEMNEIENNLTRSIELLKEEIKETKQLMTNISTNETSLDTKIERRKIEIERYEKRLQTLKKVKPAFLDEFQNLEKELEKLFKNYSIKLRCLNYLEKLINDNERVQYEKQLKIQLPKIEVINFGNSNEDEDFFLDDDVDKKQERPRAGTGGRNKNDKKNFLGKDEGSAASSLELSSDESDDLYLDKDEPELMNSDESDISILDKRIQSTTVSRLTNKIQQQINSDDDF